MSELELLKPTPTPPSPLKRWPFVCIAVGALGQLPVPLPLQLALTLIGLVGLAFVAQWLEGHWTAALAHRSAAVRLLLGALTPPVAFLVAALAVGLIAGNVHVGAGAKQEGTAGWLTGPILFIAVWFASASVGSTGMVLLDRGVSRVLSGFRARVLAVVLGLLVVAALWNVAVMSVAMLFLGAMAREGSAGTLAINGTTTLSGPALRDAVLDHPALTGLAWFAGSLLLSLPMTIAAALRLADGVVERLRPLNLALERVGAGARNVRLEEAGSRDFVEVSRHFNQMVGSLDRSERMERAFGVYVSGQVLERIRAQHGEAVIPPSSRIASVFFADIRGFTSMSEKLSAEAVVSLLNRYFARVVKLVDAHGGYLNKFIGDAVVVVFNGPVDQPDHAERAVDCALALQEEVRALNAANAFPEIGELRVGVGVATGPMVCGNIGGATQMEYTVIGDTVNLSARLTSHAGPGEVWASENTVQGLAARFTATPVEPLKVKGKEQLVHPSRVARVTAVE